MTDQKSKTRKKEEVFVRIDLETAGPAVAYFRMDRDMKDFLNIIRMREGDDAIEGIILTRDEDDPDNSYHWNIGFILKKGVKHAYN